jgi:hypothetical protein
MAPGLGSGVIAQRFEGNGLGWRVKGDGVRV